MDGGTKVQRVPLDEYLSDLRSSAQTLTCGYTHQALDDELQYQSYLKEKIDLVQDSPASNNLAVECELQDISKIIDVNQECLNYLGGITSLEDFYSDITAFNTKRALALVSQRMGAKFWNRKLSGKVKRAWQNLGRYSELVTLHLKHAADFHQLYYDARQIEMQLNERCRKFIRSKKQYNWNRCTGSVVEARELANLLKADYEHLNHLAAKAGEILDRSSTIIPIHLRHAKLEHPVKGIMLCDYETPMFKLCAGDEVLVRTSSNQVGEGHPDVNEVATNGTSTVSESVQDEESGDLIHQKPERLQERMAKTPSRPFGWEREESTTATSDSNTGASASYLTGSSHRKPTADKLHWFVRTPDGYVEGRVPAVCVLIPGPDADACQRAIALNRVLLAAWKDIIDERLAVCLEFFRRFLQQLCDSECIVTANDEEFKQLLHELIYSLSLPPTAEGETANREFLSLIEQTQTHWEKTRRADLSESTNGVHLGLTDIAAFHSVLVWMKINMKANREYEEKMHSPADVRQAMEQYSTDTFRITEAIELLSETIKKDRRKVDELLQQLRFWNQTASTELSEVLTPSLDDSRELLISSGSEVSDSDFSDLGTETEITSSPAYSEVIFRSDRYAFYTKQLYTNGGNFLPAIFTHDEQTLTNSIYSDGYSTSETENDLSEEEPLPFVELDKNLKEIAGEEVSEMQAGGVIPSKRPTRFVSTTNLDMNVMIERELDTQRSRHRCYRSRRHLETPAAQANYSVVYIEVTRDEQRDTVTEQIGGNHRSKETQTEQRVAAPKTLKMKELTEVEEEDKTVIRKKEIKTLTSVKRQTNEVSAQAKPLYVDRATDVQISLQETMVQDTRSIPCTRVWWRSKQKQNLHQESREKTADVRRRRSASWDITHDTEAGHDHWRLTKSEERKFSATRNEVHRKLKNYVDKVAMYKTRETKAKEEKQAEKEGARKPEEQKVTKWTAQEERTPKKKADTKDNQTSTQIEKPTLDMATQTQAHTKIKAVQVSSEPKEKKSRTEQRILDLTKEKDDKERKDEEKRTTEKSEEERKQIQGEKEIKVTKEISMVGVRAEGLEEPGEELEPTMRRIPLLEEDRKPGLAVSGAMIDAWCSVSLSDWVDSQLSVRPPAMPTRVCGVQTDAVLQPEGVSALVDRSSVSVSTLVGVYGSESTWTQTAEAEVESTRVWVSDRVDVTQLTKPALSLKGACVQASLLTSPLVEAAQHVLMEMRSGVSQTPIVSDTGVSDAERVRMLDVCTSYALGRVEVSDEKSYVMHADKRLWSGPPLIEASTTNAQFGVRDMRSVSVVEPTDARPGHCSTCGQRLWMETERGEMATDVDRRKPEYMEASVGADYAGVEGLERVTGVVSIGRADGTMQTRPVLSYYVTDEGHMVGVRAEGLEEPGEELEPTMRRIPLLEEDRKPGLAVSGAMIDAWCSVSLSDWVDSQLSVRPPAMPTRVCGVQTDAVLQPEGVSALVDRSSVSVSTLVGVYGSESTWTQTAEAEVESTRVWVSDRVDVTQLTKPALSLKGACVQASLLTSPLVEAAQHVLMEMRSGVSQTPIVSDTGVSDAERVRMLDVCTSYALGRVEVSDEKSYVMHADKRLWSGPPLIEASTTNAQFGVRDMRSVSVVEPTDARPGHCSTCGQHLFWEPFSGSLMAEGFCPLVDRASSFLSVFPVFSSRCVTGSSSFFDLSLKLSSSLDISTFADFSCDTSFLVVRKHFGSQYSFVPDSYDIGVLACCSSSDFGSQFYGPAFVSSDASDVRDFSFLFYEDHILHDFHERHVEHFFVPSTVSSTAASDFSCQFSPECVFRSLSFSDRVRNLFCIRSEYFDCLNYEVYQHLLAHGIVSEAACLFSGDYRSSPDLPSRLIMPECYTQTDQFESYSFLCEFETTELCQSETSSSSNYPLYMSRRTQGYLREIGCMAQDTSKTVADIGVQVVTTVRDSESLPVSSVRRLGTPTYDLNAYDTYLLRNRLGQIRDEQVSFSPPVDSVPVQTEPAMDQLGGIFGSAEIYHQKLLRDELLEVGIQCNGDSSPDNWKDFSAYFEDRSIEEHYLEVTKKRKKRFLSEVTEEIPTEAELVMCDADIQTDSDSMKLASFGRWKESRIMSRCRQVQTEPIRLRQIRSSSELCWADTELFNVILVGINATHARENVLGIHSPPDLTVPILSDHASFLAEQLNHKTAKAASCQTISDDQETQHIEPQSWTEGFGSQSHWSGRLQRGYREVEDADYSTIRDEYTHAQPAIIVQLRQRTCQYELLRTNMRQPEGMWNSIREVQSPTTNFFAPVGLAIRRGWIRLGDQNEYVDPSTGDSIPLETAYRMGRIRLATAHADTAAVMDEGMSVTLLIERIYFGWRKAKIISVIDTAKGDMLLPEAAVFEGVLEVCGDEIRFLDTMTNTWLTIEEAVGRQMIQVVAVDSSSDSSSSEEEEPATCRVYQVTHICPGGEDVLWMTTTEATRLGLFNGETGDIAADWPGRPSLHLLDAIDSRQALNVVPTKWFSFLTARHSGWIRLVRECDPQRWIVTYSMQQSEPGAVLLSRQINLVAYTNVVESDDFSESSDQSFTRWQQSRSNGMCTTGLTTEEPAVHRRYSASMFSSFFNKSTSQFPIRNTQHLETEHISYSMRKSELSRPPYATSEFQADSHTTSSSSGSPE